MTYFLGENLAGEGLICASAHFVVAITLQTIGFELNGHTNQVHCSLPSFPEELYDPTLNLINDRIVACYERRCYQLDGGEWVVWASTAEVVDVPKKCNN